MNDANDRMPNGSDDYDNWQDELVAYLDGEVSADERERIEDRLAEDDAYRASLVELERSWRMLDRLPITDPDRDFTKSTIAMVTAELTNSSSGRAKTSLPWGKIFAGLAAALLGFLAIIMPARKRQQSELLDLPVIQNLDLYRYVESVDLLKRIRDEGAVTSSGSEPVNEVRWHQSVEVNQIRSGVEQLDGVKKAELSDLRDRFHGLSNEEQARMRSLHQSLVEDPNSAALFETLYGYREWLTSLSAAERADLLDIEDPIERVAAINQLRKSQLREWSGQGEVELTRQDLEAIARFVHRHVGENEDYILSKLPASARDRAKKSLSSPSRGAMLWFSTLAKGKNQGDMPAPSPENLRRLEKTLSPAAIQEWRNAKEGEARHQLTANWMRRAMTLQHKRFAASPEELETFYLESLTSAERDELKQLPPEEMREQLRRRYLRAQTGGNRSPRRGGGQRPDGGGPRGGGASRRRPPPSRP